MSIDKLPKDDMEKLEQFKNDYEFDWAVIHKINEIIDYINKEDKC